MNNEKMRTGARMNGGTGARPCAPTVLLFFLLIVSISSCNTGKEKGGRYLDPSLPVDVRVTDLLSRLTLDEKISFLYVTQPEIPRLGIDEYHYGNEALHGIVRRNGKATVFPQAIGLAATWDPDLIHEVSTAISDEARAKYNENEGRMTGGEQWGGQFDGLLTFFSPTINMARDPRWGRTGETYGEDPLLTSRIANAFITGMQGDDEKYLKTICTPKHFVANNEEHNRFTANAVIPEKILREYYLPAFRYSITHAKAGALMSAYNSVNGVPCSANEWLLTDIVRNEWGFKGYVVCDCGAISHLYNAHHYADGPLDAAVKSLLAGVDLECGGKRDLSGHIKEALSKGLIREEDLDRAVSNVLRGRFLLGLFDPAEDVPFNSISPDVVGSEEHSALSLQAARESIVLLKNGDREKPGLLPVDPNHYRNILVAGPNAAKFQFGERNYSGIPVHQAVTPLQGIRDLFPASLEIRHLPWKTPHDWKTFNTVNKSLVPGKSEYGFRGDYFNNKNLRGEPVFTRTDPVIQFDYENMPPDPYFGSKNFSARWSGTVYAPASGRFDFRITAGGAYAFSINKQVILQNSDMNSLTSDSAGMELIADDTLNIVIDYHAGDQVPPKIGFYWKYPEPEGNPFEEVTRKAANSDLVIAFMGLDSDEVVEGGDRMSLDLPDDQMEFMQRLYDGNKNVVVVLINANPLSVKWINKNIPSVAEAWFPGDKGGTAIAEMLLGKYNPGGKLPLTFYASTDQLPPFNSYDIRDGHTYMYLKDKPLYPFGHGLSYSSFRYSELKTEKTNGKILFHIDVENLGPYAGDEVVQLYFRPQDKNADAPLKKLFAFQRGHIKTNESRTFTFEVDPEEAFSFFDPGSGSFQLIYKDLIVWAGSSSGDLRTETRIGL